MDEFLSKAIAAKELGLSVRWFMDFADRRGIEKIRRFDPETRRQATFFRAADIARLKAEGMPQPVTAAAAQPPARRQTAISIAAPPPPAQPRPWLTVAEGAEYSGLPASVILELVQSGRLRALDVGRRPGGRYRVRRRDLDDLEGALFDLPQWVNPLR
jgi:excisionase family DNA binding protein